MNTKNKNNQILFNYLKKDFDILKENKNQYFKNLNCDKYINYLNFMNLLSENHHTKKKIIDKIILL